MKPIDPGYLQARSARRDWLGSVGIATAPESENRLVRKTLWYSAVSPLAGIAVAATHGVPAWAAVLIGLVLAAAYIVGSLRWNADAPWRWLAIALVTAACIVWPAVRYPAWAAIGAVLALAPAALWANSLSLRRSERRDVLNPPETRPLPPMAEKEIRKRFG